MENPNKKYEEMIRDAQKEVEATTPPLSSFEERKEVWDLAKAEQSKKFDPNNIEQTELF
jgi:hypothetical protein